MGKHKHSGNSEGGKGKSGYFGAAVSACKRFPWTKGDKQI